tara:strand:- start:390 stop:800 length:411 start_codon:yes stop_codon:yes gene_type:complete
MRKLGADYRINTVAAATLRNLNRRKTMSGEIISFTTVEYPDETSMLKAREVFQLEMGQLADKLRPLGMTKFHSSRLFLPEDRFIIGNWLEYRDMEAYEACDKVWQESGAEFAEKYGHLFEGVTVTPHRGEVMDDYT